MLCAVLLHRRLDQSKWCSILPELVFALNASTSKSTNCIPYTVVFGRSVVSPQDIVFHHVIAHEHDNFTTAEYQQDVVSSLSDFFEQVIESLQINKQRMQQYYNKNLRFYDYREGQAKN